MGGFSIWHWLVVGIVVMLLFGKGRFSDMMGDVAKGIKSFKKGMTEDDAVEIRPDPTAAPRPIGRIETSATVPAPMEVVPPVTPPSVDLTAKPSNAPQG